MRIMMFAAAAAAMLLPGVAHADQRNFVLVNSTGYPIAELYISPANERSWEEDVLGVDVLADDDNVTIRFADDLDECVYDLKIVHSDGDSAVWGGINLCEVSSVSVSYSGDGTPMAAVE